MSSVIRLNGGRNGSGPGFINMLNTHRPPVGHSVVKYTSKRSLLKALTTMDFNVCVLLNLASSSSDAGPGVNP